MSEKQVSSFDLEGLISFMKSDKCKKIAFLVGAGISVSAGIPDFRTPGTGLYYQLSEYNLPFPEAIFEINYLQRNPQPFYQFMKSIIPGEYKPTPSHHFMKLIQDKNLLGSIWTQNIDGLERLAGIDPTKLFECHGHFYTFHCLSCGMDFSLESLKKDILNGDILKCSSCKKGLVKPDVVFFGENLPANLFPNLRPKLTEADLLFVMGTSLAVQPFCSFFQLARDDAIRCLINRDPVGQSVVERIQKDNEIHINIREGTQKMFFYHVPEVNKRDIFIQGDCDDIVSQICEKMGWAEELKVLSSK
jgi:NAD-dependent deacetylase sirtuin 2